MDNHSSPSKSYAYFENEQASLNSNCHTLSMPFNGGTIFTTICGEGTYIENNCPYPEHKKCSMLHGELPSKDGKNKTSKRRITKSIRVHNDSKSSSQFEEFVHDVFSNRTTNKTIAGNPHTSIQKGNPKQVLSCTNLIQETSEPKCSFHYETPFVNKERNHKKQHCQNKSNEGLMDYSLYSNFTVVDIELYHSDTEYFMQLDKFKPSNKIPASKSHTSTQKVSNEHVLSGAKLFQETSDSKFSFNCEKLFVSSEKNNSIQNCHSKQIEGLSDYALSSNFSVVDVELYQSDRAYFMQLDKFKPSNKIPASSLNTSTQRVSNEHVLSGAKLIQETSDSRIPFVNKERYNNLQNCHNKQIEGLSDYSLSSNFTVVDVEPYQTDRAYFMQLDKLCIQQGKPWTREYVSEVQHNVLMQNTAPDLKHNCLLTEDNKHEVSQEKGVVEILSETSRRTLNGQNLSCGGIIKSTRPTDISPHIWTEKTPSEEISTKEKDTFNVSDKPFKDLERYVIENYQRVPDVIKHKYFDATVVYHEDDRYEAEKFRNHITTQNTRQPLSIAMYDGPDLEHMSRSKLELLEMMCEFSTFIIIFFTENVMLRANFWGLDKPFSPSTHDSEDEWLYMFNSICVKYCRTGKVIPVKNRTRLRLPLSLIALRSFDYSQQDDQCIAKLYKIIFEKRDQRIKREIVLLKKQFDYLMKNRHVCVSSSKFGSI